MAFSLSVIFAAVYFLCFMLSSDLVSTRFAAETGGFVQKWLPPSLISIAGTLFCIIPLFVFKDKRIAVCAFALILLYAVLIALYIAGIYHGEERAVYLNILALYMGMPAFWGNLISWPLYFFLAKHPRKI
jgi:hypothetical protein